LSSKLTLVVAVLLVVFARGLASGAFAATIEVNSMEDVGGGAACTLRDAIAAANTDSVVAGCAPGFEADVIGFASGFAGTVSLVAPLPSIASDLSIIGPATSRLTISGSDRYRVFFVERGTVVISDLTIARGSATGGNGGSSICFGGGGGAAGVGGGVVVNGGDLVLRGITFSSNRAAGGSGGSTDFGGCLGGAGGGGGVGGDGVTPADHFSDGGAGGSGGPFGGSGGSGAPRSSSCPVAAPGGGGDGAGGGGSANPYCDFEITTAGNGGFGGGGGGGGGGNTTTGGAGRGGAGGFGGGGGGCTACTGDADAGSAGAFAGAGSPDGGGGGGAGLGGALFVRHDAEHAPSVVLIDTAFEFNSANGGSGGIGEHGISAAAGQGKGGAIFVMDGARVVAGSPISFSGNTASNAGGSVSDNADVYGTIDVVPIDSTPPTITPTVTGTLGLNGWYTSNVAISWAVSDAESVSGCEQAIVTADTPGATFTCTATSPGGTTTASVTIMRDAAPPTLACTASPSTLWPPNHKLVPVTTSVTVEDGLSGPAGFKLVSATSSESDPASDVQGWTVSDPDTSGLLRAERSGGLGHRTYTLTYQGSDAAGNSANCNLAVTVRRAPAFGGRR
jgi:hypothetical protein